MNILVLKSFIRHYFAFNFWLALAIGVLIFGAYLCVIHRGKKKQGSTISIVDIVWGLLFSTYMVILLGGTLLNRHIGGDHGIELKLFWSYREAFATQSIPLAWQIVYNAIVFIPWGFLFPQIWPSMRKFGIVVVSAYGFSIAIELIQLIFECGFFEFDDIFHNVLGTIIGYGIWKLFHLLRRKRRYE